MPHIGFESAERRQYSSSYWALHVGLPAALLISALTAGYIGGSIKHVVLDSNTSIQESVTGAMTIAAAVIVAFALARAARPLDWKLVSWLSLFIAAMIFFAGEDLNWGQYYFDRTPSDFFLTNNREQESNLHNMWPLLFNRLPRAIVEIWLVVACILVPLGWKLPVRATRGFVPEVLWPDQRLIFATVLVLVARIIRQLSSNVPPDNWLLAMRFSEVEELMIACCLLLYALMLRERIVRSD